MKRVSQNNPYRSIAFPVVNFEQFLLMPKLIECWVRVIPEQVTASVIEQALATHPWTPFTRMKALLDGTQLALELDRKALREQVHKALVRAEKAQVAGNDAKKLIGLAVGKQLELPDLRSVGHEFHAQRYGIALRLVAVNEGP